MSSPSSSTLQAQIERLMLESLCTIPQKQAEDLVVATDLARAKQEARTAATEVINEI